MSLGDQTHPERTSDWAINNRTLARSETGLNAGNKGRIEVVQEISNRVGVPLVPHPAVSMDLGSGLVREASRFLRACRHASFAICGIRDSGRLICRGRIAALEAGAIRMMRFCPACAREYAEDIHFCIEDQTALVTARTEETDDLVGRILLSRFEVLEELGHGGMGAVYRARQLSMQREVAIKVLKPGISRDPVAIKRFFKEARAASQLRHVHTITVFDFGQADEGLLFIAMELLRGRSLAAAIDEGGPMRPDRAVAVLGQVCDALTEAHRQGIIHRDIKPDNIFLTEQDGSPDFVKVLDFGIAKVPSHEGESRLTAAGQIVGTPAYMSPEHAMGRALSPQSDIYSLGVVLYEMLSGVAPFRSNSPVALMLAHLQTPVPSVRQVEGIQIPAPLDALLQRVMAKRPEDRPASAAQLKIDMFAALEESAGDCSTVPLGTIDTYRGLSEVATLPPDTREATSIAQAQKPPLAPPRGVPSLALDDDEGAALPAALHGQPRSPTRQRWLVPVVLGAALAVGVGFALLLLLGRQTAPVQGATGVGGLTERDLSAARPRASATSHDRPVSATPPSDEGPDAASGASAAPPIGGQAVGSTKAEVPPGPPPAAAPATQPPPSLLPTPLAAPSPPAAALPPAIDSAERAARFPRGDQTKARTLNRAGLKLRRAGKRGAARKAYQEAVAASPGYPWARFNLACELAAAGNKPGALEQLEALYLIGSHEAARALLAAEADQDLSSLWQDPKLVALVDAVQERAPLDFAKARQPGCRGWSARSGEVACAWHCQTTGWEPLTGLVIYRAGHPMQQMVLPSESELSLHEIGRSKARLDALRTAWEAHRIAARPLPDWELRRGELVDLAPGYQVLWNGEEGEPDRVRVVGPAGATDIEDLAAVVAGCHQPVRMDAPQKIGAQVNVRLELVILLVEYAGSCCADDAADNEHWTGVAFVHPGRTQGPLVE